MRDETAFGFASISRATRSRSPSAVARKMSGDAPRSRRKRTHIGIADQPLHRRRIVIFITAMPRAPAIEQPRGRDIARSAGAQASQPLASMRDDRHRACARDDRSGQCLRRHAPSASPLVRSFPGNLRLDLEED